MRAPDSPIRLLTVSHSLSGGGAERFASILSSHLDRTLFEPALALAVDRRSYPVPEEVPIYPLDYRGLASLPSAVRGLRGAMASFRPDVVLSNVLSTNCLTGAALGRRGDRPAWIARVGNAPELSEPRLQRWWARRCYPRATALVSNARRMRLAVEKSYPALADRCHHLANPTDFAALDQRAAEAPARRKEKGEAVVLWVGRLSRQKRPDLALAAIAEARRIGRERGEARRLRLWVCGEGALEAEARRQAAQLGLEDVVEWLGFCDNPFALMGEADCLLMTSDFEGLPNALIEAQGLGLPAIATSCPYGPDEIVTDGETGRLVPVGDATAAGEALAELLADSDLRSRWAAAAKSQARARFGLESLLPQWQELMLRAAGGR